MINLIAYDLHKPECDYDKVIAKIKSFGSCAHDEESVWLVDTTSSPSECRDALNDTTKKATYFVVRLQHNWASHSLNKDVVAWLKDSGRNW